MIVFTGPSAAALSSAGRLTIRYIRHLQNVMRMSEGLPVTEYDPPPYTTPTPWISSYTGAPSAAGSAFSEPGSFATAPGPPPPPPGPPPPPPLGLAEEYDPPSHGQYGTEYWPGAAFQTGF